jgi:hypothetical protein
MHARYLALAALAMVVACSKPIPEDQKGWVGLWKNEQASLLITADGRLAWHRSSGGSEKSISAPIQDLGQRKIVAGVWFLKTTFDVGQSPKLSDDGLWTVTVDGQELVKTDKLGRDPRAITVPPLARLRALVAADLRRLDQGIRTGNYSAFLAQSAQMFQSQFTDEKLREAYRTVHEQKAELAPLMEGELTLTSEPTISQEGELTVKGRYPDVQGRVLSVDASYVYGQGGWKTVGVNFQMLKAVE